MIGYVIPHQRSPWPEGHATRAEIVAESLPGVVLVDRISPPRQQWHAMIFDTYGEMRAVRGTIWWLARAGVPLISVARALNVRRPEGSVELLWNLVVQPGPYEATHGVVIPPLVPVASPATTDVDVLVIVSRRPEQDAWWPEAARQLRMAGLDYVILTSDPIRNEPCVTGRGAEWIARSSVVVGGAGAGTLYETLWAGKRLVATPFCPEQQTRFDAATRAGEAVIGVNGSVADAVARVRDMKPFGRRENGAGKFADLVRALVPV